MNFQMSPSAEPPSPSSLTGTCIDNCNLEQLERLAVKLVEPGKGILAADESIPTITKRFEKLGIPSTPETRAEYRFLLFGTPGIETALSGVICFEETLDQKYRGIPILTPLLKRKIVIGLKVDRGLEPFNGSETEQVTKGLESLRELLHKGLEFGVEFAKWRAVIKIVGEDLPSVACIRENSRRMAQYAKTCQQTGIMPILEPEVVIDGTHSIERAFEVQAQTLRILFEEAKAQDLYLKGILLKSSMVLPGKDCPDRAAPERIAVLTNACLEATVPREVPGVVFLSGGQSPDEACTNLRMINRNRWAGNEQARSFSFARAIQDDPMRLWAGRSSNIASAQRAFQERVQAVGEASRGL